MGIDKQVLERMRATSDKLDDLSVTCLVHVPRAFTGESPSDMEGVSAMMCSDGTIRYLATVMDINALTADTVTCPRYLTVELTAAEFELVSDANNGLALTYWLDRLASGLSDLDATLNDLGVRIRE